MSFSGSDEVRLLHVLGIQLGAIDELRYSNGVLGGDAKVFKFGGLDDDVLALADTRSL